jgi:hypothetical protein
MGSHGVSRTSGAHTRLGSLDFLVTTDGMLARALAPVRPPRSASLDAVVEALEELLPHASEARAPRGNQLLVFNYARLECQLPVFLGPSRPRRTYVTSLFVPVS